MSNNNMENIESQDKIEKKTFRNYSKNIAILLYPDNVDHAKALAQIIRRWDYTYILHDKDITSNTDFIVFHGGEVTPGDEDLKKAHYHVLLHLPMKREPSQIARELNIEPRFVQRVSDRTSYLCYLVHTGLYDKYQYNSKDVHSNRPSLFREAVQSVLTDSERILQVLDIIQYKNCSDLTFAIRVLCLEGYGSYVNKNFSLIKALVEEVQLRNYRNKYTPFGDINRSSTAVEYSDSDPINLNFNI